MSPNMTRRSLGLDIPQGQIPLRWRAEFDKMGYESVTPISALARAAIDTYRRPHTGRRINAMSTGA